MTFLGEGFLQLFQRRIGTGADFLPQQRRFFLLQYGDWSLGSGQVLLKPPAQIPAQPEGREAQEATGIRDSPIVG